MKSFRFIVLGDSKGRDNGINMKVVERIMDITGKLKHRPDFIVTLGDMVAGSEKTKELQNQLFEFKNLIQLHQPSIIIYPVVGNHEVANTPIDSRYERVLRNVFSEYIPNNALEGYNETVYYIDNYNTRLIFLNSYHFGEINRIKGRQLKWLENALKDDIQHKIVFVHSPAYPTGAHLGSCLDSSYDERNKFWKVIDENNASLVFSGHEHNYSRRIIDSSFSTDSYKFKNSIFQVISGGGGEKLRDKFKDERGVIVPPMGIHHFVIVDVLEKNIYIQSISICGKVIDSLFFTGIDKASIIY